MRISGRNQNTGETFQITVEEAGETLLSILQKHQIYVDAPCSGKGSCGRCRVRFVREDASVLAAEEFIPGPVCGPASEELLPEPAAKEKRLLSKQELEAGIRLACAVVPTKDVRIEIEASAQSEKMAVLAESGTGLQKSKEEHSFSCGIAIDIGTTTLAMELVNLETGSAEGVTTSVNHQRSYGADVISRMQASKEGKGDELRKSIQNDLNRMLDELLAQHGLRPETVKKITVAGNTTMCHLLLGFSCETLGAAPFVPVDISLQKRQAVEVLERQDISAEITILPGISAFVGADIVAGIYACGMDRADAPGMLLDIGTNGEMVIGDREGFLVTSAAAGPVFEGGNISCGVPGIPGAITHISLGEEQGACRFETIGGQEPAGLCGTGIIDITGELVRKGYVDENGTLAEPWFENGFPVTDSGITFSQRDIREIQMGKSAIRAGIETLLEQYGREPQTVFLAGGFGYFMDAAKAEQMGMFPGGFSEKVSAVGNCALAGARCFLLDEEGETRVTRIAASAREMNLAEQEQFQEKYLQYMFF